VWQKILVAPDKFKGSLTAFEAAKAIADGIRTEVKDVEIVSLPIADGGEGTAEVFCRSLGGKWRKTEVCDPLGRKIEARYCRIKIEEGILAVFEMSEASGIKHLKPEELDPLSANSFGTGELLRDAIHSGADKIIVGLGGSATTDGGIGMAAALGFRFLDVRGDELDPIPANLEQLARIEPPAKRSFPKMIAAADVENPLLGPKGSAAVYSPQKGATAEQAEKLEKNLSHLAKIAERDFRFFGSAEKGAGAAGGVGFGLAAFCGAEIVSGFDLISKAIDLEKQILSADLVITAEGKIDAQTLDGKGPAGVAALAKKLRKPVIALAGEVSDEDRLLELFDAVFPIAPGPVSLDRALKNAEQNLRSAARRIFRLLQISQR